MNGLERWVIGRIESGEGRLRCAIEWERLRRGRYEFYEERPMNSEAKLARWRRVLTG